MYSIPHNLCPAHPYDAEIKHRGDEDAADEKQPKALDAAGQPPGYCKDGKRKDEERHDVLQGFQEGEARQSPCPPLPNDEPANVECHEIDNHREHSVRVKQDETCPYGKALAYRAPHIDTASASAYGKVAV